MYTRTAQPGLWFIAGSLAQSRINSKYLALQIKAVEVGLLERARDAAHATPIPDAVIARSGATKQSSRCRGHSLDLLRCASRMTSAHRERSA